MGRARLGEVRQLATMLLSSRSSSNYVVGFCDTTCNYVVIFFQLSDYLIDSCNTTCNYVVGSGDTTCNYGRCFLLGRVPTTWLTFVSCCLQKGNGHFTWVCEPPCGIHAKSISQPGQACLSYCYY